MSGNLTKAMHLLISMNCYKLQYKTQKNKNKTKITRARNKEI